MGPHGPLVQASELITLISNVVTHTRPAVEAELIQSLNYGIGKAVRAIQSVRSQAFVSWVDPFTITAGEPEYDLTLYAPLVVRPVRLTLPGTNATVPPVIFRYRALMDPEYEARDGRQTNAGAGFFYDILTGTLPRTPQQYATRDVDSLTMTGMTDDEVAAAFPAGTLVLLPGAGASLGHGRYADFYTTVVSVLHSVVLLADEPVGESFGYGDVTSQAVVPIWQRILRLSPTPNTTYRGRLYYNYTPTVRSAMDFLDPMLDAARDLIVEYALSQLLKGTADSMHRDHLEAANELRAELMQSGDPLSGQNSEALSSGLGDD